MNNRQSMPKSIKSNGKNKKTEKNKNQASSSIK